jgi:DNA-binding MarR family transcriptional regulator
LALRARMLSRMVTSIYDAALAEVGLKISQFTVLVAVSNLGGCRPRDLAKVLEMDESTLSRNVDRMCAKGWLKLKPDEDRRGHLITLTERGNDLIRIATRAWEKGQQETERQLGAESIAALKSAVRKLRQ